MGEAVFMSEESDLEYEVFLRALGTRIKQLRNERGLTLKRHHRAAQLPRLTVAPL